MFEEKYAVILVTRDKYPHLIGLYDHITDAILEYDKFLTPNKEYFGKPVDKIYLFRRSMNVTISSGYINPLMEREPNEKHN